MLLTKNNTITAILIMAVIFIGLSITSCVTPRHIDELKMEIREVRADNVLTREMVSHMDSLITAGAEASGKLRHDVSYSNDQIQDQIDALLTNYNELMLIMQQINQKISTKYVIKSSPGVQTDPGQSKPTVEQPVDQSTPSIDCGTTYDDSFILVRRGEFDKAIEGFELFLNECSNHESVENAHYWIGESLYSLEKYVDAVTKFEFLIDNFKSSPNLSRALYQMGRSQQELGENSDAKATFQIIVDDYPGTFEANQATERLKDL